MSPAISAARRWPAPAKLNLFLHIVGRRPDGYHLLQSVFQFLDMGDVISLTVRDDGLIRRVTPLAGVAEDADLTVRAARCLQAATETSLGADIAVEKHLPMGAGLGGGSSDAATVLLALNRLWGLGWSRERLLQIAPALGADVPFFVGGRNAFVEGIGERLTPVTVQPQWFAVVKPPAELSTKAIFGSDLLARNTPAVILAGSAESSEISEGGLGGDFGRNDLQPPAEAAAPEVVQALQWLASRYGNSRMTGSGSAVFSRAGWITGAGALPEATLAEHELPPGWVGRMCRSLQAHPLVEWA